MIGPCGDHVEAVWRHYEDFRQIPAAAPVLLDASHGASDMQEAASHADPPTRVPADPRTRGPR